jgi:hypothetical protein
VFLVRVTDSLVFDNHITQLLPALKVTLPLTFIYRNDIFYAIDTVFATLYEQSKQTRGKNIPYRGFHRRSPEYRGELCCIWKITYHGIYEMVTDILHKRISYRVQGYLAWEAYNLDLNILYKLLQ